MSEDFKWTNELVEEYARTLLYDDVEAFIKSKTKKEWEIISRYEYGGIRAVRRSPDKWFTVGDHINLNGFILPILEIVVEDENCFLVVQPPKAVSVSKVPIQRAKRFYGSLMEPQPKKEWEILSYVDDKNQVWGWGGCTRFPT